MIYYGLYEKIQALQFLIVDFVKYLINELTFSNRHNRSALNQIKLKTI